MCHTKQLVSGSNSSQNQHSLGQWVGNLPFPVIVADPFLPASMYECKNILDFVNPIYRGQKFYFCSKTYPAGGTKGDGPGLKKLRKDLQKSAIEHGGFQLTSNGGGGKRCVFKCACGRMAPASSNNTLGRSSPSCPTGLLCGMNFTIRCDDAEHGYYLAGGYGKAEHTNHARMNSSTSTPAAATGATQLLGVTNMPTPELLRPVVQLKTNVQSLQQALPRIVTSASHVEKTMKETQEDNAVTVDMTVPRANEDRLIRSRSVHVVTESSEAAPPMPTEQDSINVYQELAPITKELFDVFHENRCTPSELQYIKQWMNDMINSKRAESVARVASRPSGVVSDVAVPVSASSVHHLPSRTKRPSIVHEDGEAAVLLSSFKRCKRA